MSENPTPSPGSMLTRLFWMMVGPLALVLIGYFIVKTGNGWMTGFDVAFLIILAAIVAARWVEFRIGRPQTTDGQPATPQDLRRFAVGTAVLGTLAWIAANVLGNYVLAS